MKPSGNRFIDLSVHVIAAASLASMLVFAPGAVAGTGRDGHENRAELRIKDMHSKLNITPAQEEQWNKVAQAMLDDAKNMDTLTQARIDRAKDMTAVDDLKSYGEIADAHAAGIKKLTPLFADLYAGMSDEQKKAADTLFRHGERKQPSGKKSKAAGKP
ncbi:MAG: Spy/CpxP family protein refolding chaperone [Methylobacter sp.]